MTGHCAWRSSLTRLQLLFARLRVRLECYGEKEAAFLQGHARWDPRQAKPPSGPRETMSENWKDEQDPSLKRLTEDPHLRRPGAHYQSDVQAIRDLEGRVLAWSATDPVPGITCPECGRTSYHPQDVAEGYCGHCHKWTSPKQDHCTNEEESLTDVGHGGHHPVDPDR